MQNSYTNSDQNTASNAISSAQPVPQVQNLQNTTPAIPVTTPLSMPADSFSEILQRARSNKNVTVNDVSRKTQISLSFINDIENSNFANLPDKDQCLSRLERLCLEYGILNPADILDNFVISYEDYQKRNGLLPEDDGSIDNSANEHFRASSPKHHSFGKHIHLPSVIIVTVVIGLLMLLGYAFYAYKMHKSPPQLDVDLSAHIPIYTPKPIYLDRAADKQ